ncbi:MAG: glycosyltransferase [Candidatus Gracilibacteria bacterium]|nr:glycosyltransferase [Candidatus Gracilibacteria bacterium]
MNIILVTFSPFGSNESHIRRLLLSMKGMSSENKISVLCLSDTKEDPSIVNLYPDICFCQYPINYDGWKILDMNAVVSFIEEFAISSSADLVVQTMEVWDLIRECSQVFYGKIPFATIFHAMPFLAAPLSPSGNFESDVINYCVSGIEKYRVEYIQSHYMETRKILPMVAVICANPTVTYYFNTYFPHINCHTFNEGMIIENKIKDVSIEKHYDFVYMARMERGKGVEYLSEILRYTSIKLGRKVSVAILGRTDDMFSSEILSNLIKNRGDEFEIFYFGWANNELKENILSKSRVFIYPSYYDTYAIVLAEALGFGLPCIVWDLPFIEKNYNQIPNSIMRRIPSFDCESFALAAINFLENNKVSQVLRIFTSEEELYQEDILCYKKIVQDYGTFKSQRL